MPVKRFTISRSKWARGENSGFDNKLLNPDTGRQCCVGIYLSACGVPDEDLAGRYTAEELRDALPDEAHWLVPHENVVSGSPLSANLYEDNDNPEPVYREERSWNPEDREEIRETNVRDGFERVGIVVEFTD